MGAAVVQLPLWRQVPLPIAAAEPATRRPAIPVYAIERANRCPDCHGEAFTVGRITAECAGCGLPLVIVSLRRPS
jgi:hypothetical protein